MIVFFLLYHLMMNKVVYIYKQCDTSTLDEQGRIKVRGGPRLDTVMGPYLFTARAYAMAVLGVVILSVRPSVRVSHAWIVTKLNNALQIFLYRTKGQSLCYSDTKSGWSATPPSL